MPRYQQIVISLLASLGLYALVVAIGFMIGMSPQMTGATAGIFAGVSLSVILYKLGKQ